MLSDRRARTFDKPQSNPKFMQLFVCQKTFH